MERSIVITCDNHIEALEKIANWCKQMTKLLIHAITFSYERERIKAEVNFDDLDSKFFHDEDF